LIFLFLYATIIAKELIIVKESGEMYLESIYVLCSEKTSVRSIDVAEHMNYSKPSVSRAVGLLKKDGYIEVDKDGYITLTDSGKSMANKIFERHTLLTKMLESLGVPKDVASEDACRMEHVISEETFNAMKKHFGN
jgi:Mn-dependent DtxR family transcriptional regulator